jgi:tetratricopeptide (TPR) repeat protein
MTHNNPLELVKQGDPKAIAALMNHKLQPKGITAKSSVKNGCLQIMLESVQTPNRKLLASAIRNFLVNLEIESIQKVKIYGRRTGEDIPEWHEEFEIVTQKFGLEELASQRNVKAITALISKWLQPHRITAKASFKDDCLKVMLESTEVPESQVAVSRLKDEITKLHIHSIAKVKLYGKQTEEDFPEWEQEFYLDWSAPSLVTNFCPDFKSNLTNQEQIYISTTELESEELESDVDVIRLSNSIYNTLQKTFYQPLSKRMESEEKENTIHEIVEAFNVEKLEEDIERAIEQIGKHLPTLVESFGIILDSNQAKITISNSSTSQVSDLKIAIKQMDKVIKEVLKFDFPQETDELKAFFKGAVDGFINGIAETGRAIAKEAMIGAAIGSFIAPGIGTMIGGAVGGWLAGTRQQEEIQTILEKYEQAREKVFQEWETLWKITYESICQLIINCSSIDLLTYQVFQQSETFLEQGNKCLEKEKFTEAIEFYEKALSLNPQFSMAWNNKGLTLRQVNLNEEAISNFDKAIVIDNNILAWKNKIATLQEIGEHEKAIIICDQLIKIEPDNFLVWLSKGISLEELKQHEKSLQVFDQLISLESENYIGWYEKSRCLVLMGKVERAIDNLKEAIRLNPEQLPLMLKNDSDYDCIRDDERFQALIESSVGIDYSHLKKLLIEKKWKEADKETARLMSLVVTNQKKSLNIFDQSANAYAGLSKSEIENLPIIDLNTIDNLWLKYSEKKFGFSIQKEIYESLGGTQEFNGEIRDKFGKETAWRVYQDDNYSWRLSDNFVYDYEKAPKGHLPSSLWAGLEDGWFENRRDRLIALFARINFYSINKS